MKILFKLLLLTILTSAAAALELPKSASPEGAHLYIISPADGAVVSNPVKINFGLKGMGVSPAGFDAKATGHHHLLVDTETLPSLDLPLGADVLHFGAGQTEAEIELAPGTHTLQLILGNYLHIPHNPAVISKKITVTVK